MQILLTTMVGRLPTRSLLDRRKMITMIDGRLSLRSLLDDNVRCACSCPCPSYWIATRTSSCSRHCLDNRGKNPANSEPLEQTSFMLKKPKQLSRLTAFQSLLPFTSTRKRVRDDV